MNCIVKIFFYLLILKIVYDFIKNKEGFKALTPSYPVVINKSIGKNISKKTDFSKLKNCCYVKKVFDKDKKEFVYKYKKISECQASNLVNSNTSNIFVDGVNGWDNKYCREPDLNDKSYDQDKMLGSCKMVNFECKDFMTRDECKKFNLEWTDKTCNTVYQKPFKVKPYEMQINGKILKV